MTTDISIIIIDDEERDEKLLERALRKEWPDAVCQWIDNEDALRQALECQRWSIVLSDFRMPQLKVTDVLRIINKADPILPIIIVSGILSTEDAVELMRSGAKDFIRKDDLARLVPAVQREITESEIRREHYRAEQELKETEELFRVLATAANDAVIIMDADGKVSFWNEGAERIFGYSPEEVLGSDLHFLVAFEEDRTLFGEKFIKFQKTGEGALINQTFECTSKRKDGNEFPVELSISAVPRQDKWNSIGIVRDISNRKINENRLRQSEKMDALGNMAGGLAHDLKNMLFPILTLTSLTMKNLPEGSHNRERLEKVVRATERATQLVENIHSFSHKEDMVWKEIDLRDLIEETLGIIRPILPASIEITTDFESTPCMVLAEPVRLETAIINLASNAADAMESQNGTLGMIVGKTVINDVNRSTTLTLDPPPDDYVKLTFFDTGVGMNEETLQHLFDPYYSTKERGHGTGLGMTIVQKVIIEHNGTINVSSQPGVGTTFDIFLPAIHRQPPDSQNNDKTPIGEMDKRT